MNGLQSLSCRPILPYLYTLFPSPAKINVFTRCLPSRRAPAVQEKKAVPDSPVSVASRDSDESALSSSSTDHAVKLQPQIPLGLPEGAEKRLPRLDSPILLETSRRKILAFVHGSKDVVISTGRAIGRVVMGASSSSSSPEPDDIESMATRLHQLLLQKPCRMSDMLKVIGILGETTPGEKQELIKLGVLSRILSEIEQCSHLEHLNPRQSSGDEKRRQRIWTRRPSTTSSNRGVGYGRGSTKSRWDIERTVEERIAQEEHLMWLLCSLTTFLCGDALSLSESTLDLTPPKDQPVIQGYVIDELNNSPLLSLFEYHFNNDSVFDISQHMDFYQALIELAAALAYVPDFLPLMVQPRPDAKSIVKELLPRFKATLNAYPSSVRGQSSPDFALMDFIRKVNDLSDIIFKLTKKYEINLPPERRIKTAVIGTRKRPSIPIEQINPETLETGNAPVSINAIYAEALQDVQIQTHKILNEGGKPLYGFTFKKELRNVNPFSPSMKDRTKRIAKELASMHNSLPLNASNGIFVCMDETRCDILKILISGPDDTPYQNGLFEFDVFFPNNYPQAPPKCSFLTTGSGTIRFNPNLYNDGKICLSILGTWEGRPEEKWNPFCSLLQVLISIQGLIFVKHPYFNEPGFEKFQGTPKGEEYSRKYNLHIENATMLYAIMDMYKNGPTYFKDVIQRHFWVKRQAVIEQAERWIKESHLEANQANQELMESEALAETAYINPVLQRQSVDRLIAEFKNMKNPMEK
ncbi:unnamed protein product [Bursaphelenchus xylophilus]|uniref:(pine wood nematode) hypothetical protein n=1 Tax=Bursaphelenchus xylophilus TaxID=6326 RepID=A0A1I7SM16_BURXY|nr:unnamed protein product [Bursaphelenchus xylophilus]CAG9129962.1 unnamed protein product [Bursaphelenchus xylophilus]